MALIKCPECDKEISDQASNCPNCGFPIQQRLKEEEIIIRKEQERMKKEEQEKKRNEIKKELKQKTLQRVKNIKPIHIIGIGVILLIMMLITNNMAYNNAIKSFESKNYKSAYKYFKNSDYRDSKQYREKSIIEYTKVLIEEKDFESADQMLNLIVDEAAYDELKRVLVYEKAVEAYEEGTFEFAYKLLQDIKDYKDAKTYLKNAEMMKNIQGEWNLSGYIHYEDVVNFAALTIDGWNATLYYCKDKTVTYEKAGSCRLNIENIAEASLEIGTTKYTITSEKSGSGEKILVAFMLNDDYIDSLDYKYSWQYYGSRKELCFFEMDDGIPKKPAIGMTAEEVKKSTWGAPIDINKSTYSWGVKEQWCYSDNRYIYLEDGIVTSISE